MYRPQRCGAGYGNRTRLHGLGSRCITDIRTLHREIYYSRPRIKKQPPFSAPVSANTARNFAAVNCKNGVRNRNWGLYLEKSDAIIKKILTGAALGRLSEIPDLPANLSDLCGGHAAGDQRRFRLHAVQCPQNGTGTVRVGGQRGFFRPRDETADTITARSTVTTAIPATGCSPGRRSPD